MTAARDLEPDVDPITKHGRPSKAAIRAAGEIYAAILLDPDESTRLRAAREARKTRTTPTQ